MLQAKVLIARRVVFNNVGDRHWFKSQKDDLVLSHICGCMTRPKENQQTLSEYLIGWVQHADCLAYACHQKDLIMKRDLMHLETNALGTKERILTFLVPSNKCQAMLDGCH